MKYVLKDWLFDNLLLGQMPIGIDKCILADNFYLIMFTFLFVGPPISTLVFVTVSVLGVCITVLHAK